MSKKVGSRTHAVVSRLKALVSVTETFLRSDGASLGKTDSGASWSNVRGSWGISSNKASSSDAASGFPLATLNFSKEDVTLIAKGVGPAMGTAFWVTDSNNWWGTYVDTEQTCQTCSSGGNCSTYGTVLNAASNCATYANQMNAASTCKTYGTVLNANSNCSTYGTQLNANPTCSTYGTQVTANATCKTYGTQCNANNATVYGTFCANANATVYGTQCNANNAITYGYTSSGGNCAAFVNYCTGNNAVTYGTTPTGGGNCSAYGSTFTCIVNATNSGATSCSAYGQQCNANQNSLCGSFAGGYCIYYTRSSGCKTYGTNCEGYTTGAGNTFCVVPSYGTTCNAYNQTTYGTFSSGGNCATYGTYCNTNAVNYGFTVTGGGNCSTYGTRVNANATCTGYATNINANATCSTYGTVCNASNATTYGTACNANNAAVYGLVCNANNAAVYGTQCNANNAAVYGSVCASNNAAVYGTQCNATNALVYSACNCVNNDKVKIVKNVAGTITTVATLAFNATVQSIKTVLSGNSVTVSAYSDTSATTQIGSSQATTISGQTKSKVHGILKGVVTYSPATTSTIDQFEVS